MIIPITKSIIGKEKIIVRSSSGIISRFLLNHSKPRIMSIDPIVIFEFEVGILPP